MIDFQKGNIVPLRFQSFEELQRTEQEIFADHYEAWHAAFAKFDHVDAALKGDDGALAKCTASEMTLAKAEAARHLREFGALAKVGALEDLVATLRHLNEVRDAALFGYGAVARRSLRFARSNPDRFYGPGASSLPPKAS
ncbi:hypothetical protein [Bradyrhizobium sp. F1.13.3]|uniref:hypothetical protein n=1 Tax=Bradyrhizobium sp. F1.13.3 TaxID=3156351 RepID=UPI0033985CCD